MAAWLRRGDVIREMGITKHEVTKLVRSGLLKPVRFRFTDRCWAYYEREEIERLLNGRNGRNGGKE